MIRSPLAYPPDAAEQFCDLRDIRSLIEAERHIRMEFELTRERRESEDWQDDAEALLQVTRLLLTLVTKMKSERDELREQLSNQSAVSDLYEKFERLKAFADRITPFEADRRMTPARRYEARRDWRAPDYHGARRAARMA